ncbi:MAG: hypothetical protein ACRELD_09120 [Longimicrobiales bacterium]
MQELERVRARWRVAQQTSCDQLVQCRLEYFGRETRRPAQACAIDRFGETGCDGGDLPSRIAQSIEPAGHRITHAGWKR